MAPQQYTSADVYLCVHVHGPYERGTVDGATKCCSCGVYCECVRVGKNGVGGKNGELTKSRSQTAQHKALHYTVDMQNDLASRTPPVIRSRRQPTVLA